MRKGHLAEQIRTFGCGEWAGAAAGAEFGDCRRKGSGTRAGAGGGGLV